MKDVKRDQWKVESCFTLSEDMELSVKQISWIIWKRLEILLKILNLLNPIPGWVENK